MESRRVALSNSSRNESLESRRAARAASSRSSRRTGHDCDRDVNEPDPYHDAIVVKFDLDLTNTKNVSRKICQIAASYNDRKFQVYIYPDVNIDRKASKEHGIKKGYKKLHRNNEVVESFSPKEGLEKFLKFLRGLTKPPSKVLLAAHGCSSTHRHALARELKECDLIADYQSVVLGTINTIEVFKKNPTCSGEQSHALKFLAEKYLKNLTTEFQEGCCDANVKVNILELLLKETDSTDAMLKKHVKRLDDSKNKFLKECFGHNNNDDHNTLDPVSTK